MIVDNFALNLFQVCPAKYKLRIVDKWTTRRKSAALGFGGAIHEGLAVWYKTADAAKAVMAIKEKWPTNIPIDDWRTLEKCVTTFLAYVKAYPVENFKPVGWPDKPMIECKFTLETGYYLRCWDCWSADESPGTIPTCSNCGKQKEPIEYGGIFDGLVDSDEIYVLEHKTASQFGKYYFDQFKPNGQVTGYIWGGNKMSGQRVGGAIINAIVIYKASPPKFERQITTRSQAEIDEWLHNVYQTCLQIQDCMKRNYWPWHTCNCTMYGKCEFHNIHTLGTERERELYLDQDYVKDEWSHEDRDDGTVAE